MQSDVLELLIIYSVKSNQMINSIIFIGAISPEVVRKLNLNSATHFHKKTNAFNGLHIFATKRFFFVQRSILKKGLFYLVRENLLSSKTVLKMIFGCFLGLRP